MLSTICDEDLGVAEQHAFVSQALVGARRVLEVGAGQGHLARRLQAEGLSVTAIDIAPRTKSRRRMTHRPSPFAPGGLTVQCQRHVPNRSQSATTSATATISMPS